MDFRVSRFHMKHDWARVEVRAAGYFAYMNSRWPSLRLCMPPAEEPLLSYSAFGAFLVGEQDLVCDHAYRLHVEGDGRRLGWKEGARCFFCERTPRARFEFEALAPGRGGVLAMDFVFPPEEDRVELNLRVSGLEDIRRLRLPLRGAYLYPLTRHSGRAASFFSPGSGNGLRVSCEREDVLSVEAGNGDAALWMEWDRDEDLRLVLQPLRTQEAPAPPAAAPPRPAPQPCAVESLPSWERRVVAEQGWTTPRAGVRDRVAGLYVSVPEWHHAQSNDPHGHLETVERDILDRVLASGAFQVVGMSRDGIYEGGYNRRWLTLVERVHEAGLPVIMKPGDQELTQVFAEDAVEQWVRDCFDVPAERQSDAIRLCWEAVMWPWVTADLCLARNVLPPAFPDLSQEGWASAADRIQEEVAAKFDRLIRLIRGYAPHVTVDLECGDTRVFRRLLERHDNLGVMYMCYGEYPRVGEYLDLYYHVARDVLKAGRVVLETDCYYTQHHYDVWNLRAAAPEEMYPPEQLERMAAKHRHMNSLPAEAAWAWGINLNYMQEKFDAVCGALPAVAASDPLHGAPPAGRQGGGRDHE